MTCIRKVIRWIKQLNLFKSVDNRTASDAAKQRIITRTYLILFAGMVPFVFSKSVALLTLKVMVSIVVD